MSANQDLCRTIVLDFFSEDQAEITLLAIHPEYQGQKLGPMIMKHTEDIAFQKVSTAVSKVIPLFQEKLVKFYYHLGYKTINEETKFGEEDQVRYILPEYRDQIYCSIMHKHKNS